MNHLAIFSDRGTIEKIFNCQKTVESRFSQKRIAPYKKIMKDDTIYLKLAGEKILGKVVVDNVLYFDNLEKKRIRQICTNYQKELAMEKNFWYSKNLAKHASLIFLKNPSRFLAPLKFIKRDKRGWVVLENDL